MANRRSQAEQEGPERTCVATRTVRPPDELIRFVVGPDDQLVPDLKRKLPGRGVWVTASRQAVEEAARKKAFARSLKASVKVPATLADDIERLLERDARDSLSMANKAGQVVAGFSKVEAAIAQGVAGILQATDAAADGVRKIGQALRRRYGERADAIPVVAALDSSELGLALGRSHVIHAALLEGPAARACLARCRALERYRAGLPDGQVPADPTHMALAAADTTTREPQEQERND
ncbi:RNA-binding protein [Alsobacter soli]|uniref:RNA-binding protein n=1 Tax=Alsobacter soli TaxID=2109933 RepID=A0A2T1HT95_9HYPH|nr:RNA-binding protein [Alsobacter soli]PSC04867.1 RNA-binding protein [Alsobacter soli]